MFQYREKEIVPQMGNFLFSAADCFSCSCLQSMICQCHLLTSLVFAGIIYGQEM